MRRDLPSSAQNTGSNSPRFLHPLKRAVERGCKIVTFNPVRERGLIEFTDPQNPVQMTVGTSTSDLDGVFSRSGPAATSRR